jgi:PAS domain S-box-containing protein
MKKPLRVLMVEDSEDDVLLTIHVLRKGGYDPVYERVEDAGAMRNALEKGSWDVILCDYRMPKFDGFAAIALLKETNIDIPLIIVSGAIGEEMAVECMRSGARDFFMKGKLSRLASAVERELKEAESRRQRKHAEGALLESENKYRLIFNNAPLGILHFNEKGIITSCNDNFVEIIGSSRAVLVGLNMLNLPDQHLVAAVKLALHGKLGNYDDDYRSVTSSKVTPVHVLFAPIATEKGEVVGGVGIIEDITERKKTEKALVQVAREWQDTFDATNDAMWILDQDQKVLRSNRTAELFFHRPLGEMIGKHCWEIVHGTEQPIPECPILRVRKSLHRETMDLQVDERWFEVIVDPILDEAGRYSGAVHIVSDITGRKQAEAEIRQSEERFRAIFERSTIGKSLTAPDGKLLQINKTFADMLGYTIEEVQQLNFAQITHPDDVAESRECIRILLAGEQIVYRMEKRYIHKSGDIVWTNVSTTLLRDEQGMPLYFITSIVDITERKRAEEQLQDTLESLRKAVGTTIQVMVSAVETRDPYTSGHQIRSADLARAIATEMLLPQDKIEGIRMAGSIHDIGKLSIPAEILSKPTKLTEIEFSLIQEHARKGYEILKDVESPWPLAEIVHQHHERMDGSGYPRNLKGEEILIEARILTVADVVEAMASHRPYRPGLGIAAALNEIEKNSGILYDNAVVGACLRLFREKGHQLEQA